MDDAAAMRGVERLGDLNREVNHPRRRQRPILDQVLEGPPFEQLHHDERLPVVLAELVNRTDVRVLQGGSEPRLALEPRQPLRRRNGFGAQQLDRHLASELFVLGAKHYAHAAFAEAVQQAIVGDNGWCHRHGCASDDGAQALLQGRLHCSRD